jgi:hypothetical protein
MRIRLTLILLLALAPLFATPAKAGDLIDIAIEVVNPDLKPARPVVMCAVNGGNIKDCALAQGKKEFAENEDVKRIFRVYNLAKDKKWEALFVEVGLTVVCTAFEVPGKDVICNEFGKKIAEYGTKALKFAKDIHKDIGEKLLKSFKSVGKKIGCITHVYCDDEDKEDPNKFYWYFGKTTLSMPKFDLGAIWTSDYAARVPDGIKARLNDAAKLQRMVADPPPRVSAGEKKKILTPAAVAAKAKALGGKSAADLRYFLAEDTLASSAMNAITRTWFLIGVEGDRVNVHLHAFAPFRREMNARWLAEVNKAAGETLEQPAQDLLKVKDNWRKQLIEPIGVKYFDSLSRPNQAAIADELKPCRAAVDAPAMLMQRWARAAGTDKTTVAGHNASWWSKAQSKDWCANLLNTDMAGRRQEYDAAVSWGCTRKTGFNAKGLDCPEKAIAAKKPNFADDPGSSWTSTPKGEVGVVPIELCQNAYSVNGVVNPAYCTISRARMPGVAAPPQPGTTSPGMVPQPAPQSEPAFRFPQVRQQAPPQKSTLCVFDAGPRAGERQDYAPMAPLPVGTPCHDGRGSTGKVVAP